MARSAPVGRLTVELRVDDLRLPLVVTRASVGPAADDDRRVEALLHHVAYANAERQGLLGLLPAILPDPPTPDSNGNITVELRLLMGSESIGTTTAELRAWVAELASGSPDDPRLAVESWVATAIGGTAPEHRTLWHHLAEVPRAEPATTLDDLDEATLDATIDSVVAYLRDQAPEQAAALDLDAAGDVISSWLERGMLDPARAVDVAGRDLADVLGGGAGHSLDDTAEHLAAAWQVLETEGAHATLVDEGRGIVYPVAGEHGQWYGVIEQRDPATVVVYSLVPVELPPERFVEAMELTLRLNEGMTTSSFDLDVDTGEMAVRTGLDLTGREPRTDPALDGLRRAIRANAAVLDDHLEAVEAFCSGSTVSEAIASLTSPT